MGYPVKDLALLWVNATIMSFFNWLVLGFRASHDVRGDGFLQASIRRILVPIHALVTNGLAGLLVWRALHAFYRYHKQLFTDRTSIYDVSDSRSLLVSHTRKRETRHTHTQRQAVTMNAAFDSRDMTSARSRFFRAFRNFWGFLLLASELT